ncbi:hypothetical protein SAMN04489759_10739 [Sulfitobacter delicatus]|uniref:Uncharacterized protein n=1 Tax=Sulfitobacter delicatus TaxID=218672 RepID=A0A1G7TTF2_9RHOB|nr:hypothetical protein [Sulfitobacter delicatus]SDG37979.1 hypothetical protein SAMN04489759_10739 [Sulfitobacter delicatus]
MRRESDQRECLGLDGHEQAKSSAIDNFYASTSEFCRRPIAPGLVYFASFCDKCLRLSITMQPSYGGL